MTGTGLEVWPDVLAHLRRHHPTICRRWFAEELKPAAMRSGTLSVRAQSSFHREYLANYCNEPFTEALQSVTGRLLAVRFIGPDDAVETASPTKPASNGTAPRIATAESSQADRSAVAVEARPAIEDVSRRADEAKLDEVPLDANAKLDAHTGSLVIDPDYEFGSFVVGPSNRLAHAAAIAVAQNPGKTYNPLFIHGDVGLGKTHLLQSICLNVIKAKPDAIVCYLSCEGFMTQFMHAVRQGRMIEFRYRFRDVDILVVDDIHYLGKRDRTQEEFFHTFNTLYQAGKQIVLSSDAAPENIPDLQDRLVSRFKWGLVASVEAPSFETRIEILKTKAEIRGFVLPDDVAFYIAQHADSHVRELESHISKLQLCLSIDEKPITIEMAREALALEVPLAAGGVTIHTIIEAVTEQFDIRLTELQSKDRTRSVALPRQVCMYLAKHNTHLSLKEIGGYFGGRDHTTVLHAVRTVETKRASDEQFNASLKALETRLRPKP